jgi:hypothetical protein
MNSRIGLLTALLVVQLVLVGVAFVARSGQDAGEPFLELDPKAVTGITISGTDTDTVELSRTTDGWRVGELPADADKITDVIDKLVGGSANWPVATSKDSQERFEVTEDKHQRRVDFHEADGTLATVYIGTSPGYRRVHARRDGEDAIYSIDFAVHELPTAIDDWLDKQLFASEGIRRIALPGGRVLEKTGDDGGWTLDGTATDPEAVQRYLDRVGRLSVLGVYRPAETASADAADQADEPGTPGEAKIVQIDTADGSQRLTFRLNASGDEYVLTSDRFPGEFRVASYVAEQILADPGDLIAKPDSSADASALPEPEPEPEPDAGDAEPAAP